MHNTIYSYLGVGVSIIYTHLVSLSLSLSPLPFHFLSFLSISMYYDVVLTLTNSPLITNLITTVLHLAFLFRYVYLLIYVKYVCIINYKL